MLTRAMCLHYFLFSIRTILLLEINHQLNVCLERDLMTKNEVVNEFVTVANCLDKPLLSVGDYIFIKG